MNYNINLYGMSDGQALTKLQDELNQISFDDTTIIYITIGKAGDLQNKITNKILNPEGYIYSYPSSTQIIVNGKL
tara:strand:+ start:1342 stop:1566 length:225 start_codon:yes stop_codon:yes gene_type:complete